MYIRNCWYVIAWRDEVQPDALFERTVLGESLLVYRKDDGTPVIMDNRCPHRNAPLSMGRKVGDQVRCMYHGLVFDPSGRCVQVPGQERIVEGMQTRQYPAVQKGTWIWVWMGDPALADPALIPDTFSLDHPEWRYKPGGYLHYDANYQLIHDNLLDFSHLSYVHENTVGGPSDIAEARPVVEKVPQGVRVTRDVRNTTPAPYHAKLGQFDDLVNRRFAYDFLVPGILIMHVYVKPADTPDDDMRQALRLHSCQAVTPETETSSHYFFMQANAFKLEEPSIPEAIYDSLTVAFAEDHRMINAQQALISRCGSTAMQPIAADAALGQFRFVMKQRLDQEQRR